MPHTYTAIPLALPRYTTDRGFAVYRFFDYYQSPCSLQASSLADADALWLGVDDPRPSILASDADSHDIETSESTGWIPYPVPSDVKMATRMHLTREQVATLLPILQRFVETGEI